MAERLAIIGLGLIGGSLAAALKKRKSDIIVIALGRDPEKLKPALDKNLIDEVSDDLASGIGNADLVVLGTPVGATGNILLSIKEFLQPGTVVTDVGSTKLSVIQAVKGVYGDCPAWFVPGHPIAGKELSGFAHADPELFVDRKVVLTPVQNTDEQALQKVRALWQSVGAEVHEMDAAAHDRILTLTSHLPHLLSFALVSHLGQLAGVEDLLQYAAGGFRDFSRIGASDPQMWRDIFFANKGPLLESLARYQESLSNFSKLLSSDSGDELLRLLRLSQQVRNQRFPSD